MKKVILPIAACAFLFLGIQAKAHDECDEDHVSQVDHYRGEDVVHYDHHHYGYDAYGNEIVIHHDHHTVVPNDDYGYRRRHGFARFFFGN
jgi:hypothetical protein